MLTHHHLRRTADIALALGLSAALPSTAAAAARRSDNRNPQRLVVRIVTPASGFDWGDAGIGAAGGVAVSMLGVGAVLVLSQSRSRHTTP